ncbi:MAG: 30S ribosomal protein S6 [Candidatus Omnitrophica bacterium]|nr:30S ribosomal protein S6 [Candidatus Omnitrophota bacterium]
MILSYAHKRSGAKPLNKEMAGKMMKNMKKYSILFIIYPDKEEKLADVTNQLKAIVTENGGEVGQDNLTGKKRLSYPMNKKTEGIYYELHLSSEPKAIEKISRLYTINTDLLRHIITVLD